MVETLDAKVCSLAGVQRTKSRWSNETAYVIKGKEFAHFHGQNELDVRLTRVFQRKFGSRLEEDSRIRLRPRPSEWIAITLATKEDTDFAFELVKQAWSANGG